MGTEVTTHIYLYKYGYRGNYPYIYIEIWLPTTLAWEYPFSQGDTVVTGLIIMYYVMMSDVGGFHEIFN